MCGVRCTEIDLAEANLHAFHSTAHAADDSAGMGAGIGGHHITQEMRASQYGPGAATIDTRASFRVSISFESADGSTTSPLVAITTNLQQEDRCVASTWLLSQ